MKFDMSTHYKNSIPVISISGDLTSHEVSPVCAELVKYIKSNVKGIAIDLTDTSFIDSQGLGIIIYCSQLFKKASKLFFLINPRDFLKSMMNDLSCDQIFAIIDSEEQIPVN